MTDSYKSLVEMLKRLPGVGYRSAERMALHLLLERPEELLPLAEAMQRAQREVKACSTCGNLAEGSLCEICANDKR